MPNTTEACPECDEASLYKRQTKTPPWRCNRCGHEFDEPVTREVRAPGSGGTSATADESPAFDVIPTDTPDTVFADVGRGDKVQTDAYAGAHVVDDVVERTVWRVPFAPDWVDAEIVLANGGLNPSEIRHRAHVDADGTVQLAVPGGTTITLDEVEPAGTVSPASYLKYCVDDSTDETADPWADIGGDEADV